MPPFKDGDRNRWTMNEQCLEGSGQPRIWGQRNHQIGSPSFLFVIIKGPTCNQDTVTVSTIDRGLREQGLSCGHSLGDT